MKKLLSVLALICAALFATGVMAAERTVVVVLFDGFSPAMLDEVRTPNFDRIKREGVWSRHLVPAFPTLSMTNHNTFSTGCWPAHHGILSNIFYDPKRGLFGRGTDVADADWRTGCETMWEAAERQNVRAGVINWVGRWSSTRGPRATYVNLPDARFKEVPDDEVLAQGLRLLRDNGPKHARLIALYFQGPDEEAHYNGVVSPQVQDAVRHADAIVGKLMKAIAALPKNREGTLVIGTDHGMIDVGPLVNIGRLINVTGIHVRQASDGGVSYLYLDKGENAARVAALLAPYHGIFQVYPKGHFPPYAHLGTGPRAPDLMLVTHPPYWMVGPEMFPDWANALGVNHIWPVTFTPFTGGLKATHGFDPNIVQMHGIFFAWGAGIAKGKQIPRLDMIDIHPTVMQLLGLKPGQPMDGHVVAQALGDRK